MSEVNSKTVSPLSQEQFNQLIQSLGKLWIAYQKQGLETRLQMGENLNDTLGDPDSRQAHGKQVLKKVSDKLSIAESDLNRMRWFAFLFQTIEVLKQDYPDVTNWTHVKQKLPEWIAKFKGIKPQQETDATASADLARTKILQKSVCNLIEVFRGDLLQVESRDHKLQIVKEFKQMVEASQEYLGLRITVEEL
jgi:hypothetical protein